MVRAPPRVRSDTAPSCWLGDGSPSRGADTTALDSTTSAKLLQEHLAHQDEQAKRGLIVMAGPFGDKSDWRGLLLYDCETKEEVEGYLRRDPLVARGRLKYDLHPWYGAVGTTLK